MSTMTDETYNGYKNRETWAFNLHWQNDQGLYNGTLEQAQQYLTETYGEDWADLPADEMRGAQYGVGEHVVTYWREMAHDDETEYLMRLVARDVGSWWRVDHMEVGAAVLESLDAEGVEADTDDE